MSEDDRDPALAGLPSPRANADLIGHDDLRAGVEARWRAGRLHHGMLLAGPRGIGKATFAYAVAAMLLSHSRGIGEGLASPARGQLANGAAQGFRRLAVGLTREGKPKKQIGVDEVRALEPFLRQRAGADAWRVVLVDAADDLNASSANALLKVLEEPGERTLFILIAHRPGALLPTIRSRCEVYRPRPLTETEVRAVLARSDLSPEAVETAVPHAGGSVRRAIVLAESGAGEALGAAAQLLDRPRWSPVDAARVTDLATARGADAVFAEVAEALPAMLGTRAVRAARGGDAALAGRAASAASAIERDLGTREAYGVDRALSLRAALHAAHAALHPALAVPSAKESA